MMDELNGAGADIVEHDTVVNFVNMNFSEYKEDDRKKLIQEINDNLSKGQKMRFCVVSKNTTKLRTLLKDNNIKGYKVIKTYTNAEQKNENKAYQILVIYEQI